MKKFLEKNNLIVVASGAFAFLIGIFGPIEFYFSNIYNVWYDLYNIFPITLLMFAGCFIALSLLGVLVGTDDKKRRLYAYIVSILTICLYIQGTFVKIPYGEMNGETIEWDKYAADNLKSSLLGIALIAIAVIIYKKKQNEKMFSILKTAMICLVLIQLISMVVVGASGEGFKAKKSMRPVDENAFLYSEDENLIILVLDTFDARVFEDYALDNNQQKIANQYEDFTYFRDTMGMFTLTNYAFPHIVSGEKYLGDMYYGEYIEQAYAESPLIDQLKRAGWNIRIHTDQSLPQKSKEYFENAQEITYKIDGKGGMTKGIYKLVLFKYFPTALKKYVYYPYEYLEDYKQVKTIDGIDADKCSYTEDSWDNKDFYDSIDKIEAGADKKNCQIYHIKGLHALRNLDKDMNYIHNSDEMYSLKQEAEVVSDIVASYLEKMKQAGAYDNSTIVIMADHGSVEYITEDDNFAQCPLLMIKGKGEKHEFKVSKAPVSYDDLQNIYSHLLAGETAAQAVDDTIAETEETKADYETYGIDELIPVNALETVTDEVNRRRYMIFHKFSGNLGGKSKGSIGYELYTDYPAYYGYRIQIGEKTY